MVPPLPPKFGFETPQCALPMGREGAARRASPFVPGQKKGASCLLRLSSRPATAHTARS
jgi:hypothetical protein